jgi:general secretion pathway protein G
MRKQKFLKFLSNEKGVTLIELIIVIIIMTTLALIIMPRFMGRTEEARRTAAVTDIQTGLGTAIDLYESDNGRYPVSLEELVSQPENAPNWRGPYLKSPKLPKDPWGMPYQYKSPGGHNPHSYDLFSLGRDKKAGGEGYDADIGNW